MRYTLKSTVAREPDVGDVRRFELNEGGEMTAFIGVVVGVDQSSVKVRRCYKEDQGNGRYQMKDVGMTGLEYAMFIDDEDRILEMRTVGRRYGCLSKRDMRNIRK